MLNTTLIYEFAVFKKYAEPLLKAIPLNVPEAAEAQSFWLCYERLCP